MLIPTADLLREAVPAQTGAVACPGLDGGVTLHRDRWGIPHIRAGSAHDAFFGQGFAMAQERLWQMEYDRRRAAGRWAELVGPAALAQDMEMRRFQLARGLAADFAALAPATRAMLEAYAAGVNACVASLARLPAEFTLLGVAPEPWRPLDSLAVYKVRHILMGVFECKLWRARLVNAIGPEATARLHPDYQRDTPVILPPGGRFAGPMEAALEHLAALSAHLALMGEGEPGAGSNSWVVGGARTRSGLPLLAGDPHRALDVPNVYCQNHVACPEFDVIGYSFPGVPGFPHFAHNAQVAWAITHGYGDTQDLYIERFDPARPDRYLDQGTWRPAEIARETIKVQGGAAVAIELVRTRRGEIIAGDPRRGAALAFRFTANCAPDRTFDSIRAMLSARDADALEESLRPWVDPVNNLVYADVHGAYGYRTRGTLPVRHRANGWLPVPGWTGEHDWRGTVPFEEMPAVRNPAAGFVLTANNRIVGREYPHYIGSDFSPPTRAERILALLREARGLTVADMSAMQADVTSVAAAAWAVLLRRRAPDLASRLEPLDPSLRAALELLRDWDGTLAADSPAATIYGLFRQHLLRLILEPALGALTGAALGGGRGEKVFANKLTSHLHRAAAADDPALLPPGASWGGLIGQALGQALQALRERLGDDPARWRWDALHRSAPQHLLAGRFPGQAALLNPPPIAMGGDADTIQAASYTYWATGFAVTSQSVARYVFDPADWNRSGWVVPSGASGHPGSPHYGDQAAHYEARRLLPMTYDWARIATEAASTQHLEPARR
ncbi:MAG: penicillin acylase family protein [Candidatus Lambdaproteobacteria bacterium]|nr:penicillin acylase family protein [Candidatus Lambdaproteobacteria bacterium]